MSYEYSKVVYWQVHDTTPTEQSVLETIYLGFPAERARETSQIAINIHFIFPQYRLAVTPPQVQRELGRGPQWPPV